MIAHNAEGVVVFDLNFDLNTLDQRLKELQGQGLTVARERVEKGLAWLKESGRVHDFDLNRVNLNDFNVGSAVSCTLSQSSATGHYVSATNRLRRLNVILPLDGNEWERQHGFMDDYGVGITFSMLTAVWREAITADRQLTAAAA